MGGEKLLKVFSARFTSGSPPHGRGKEATPHIYPELSRITPAWAGKSAGPRPHLIKSQDHPRMGGEKSISAPSCGPGMGSPPHGRGKGSRNEGLEGNRGITPAWAGKSEGFFLRSTTSRDHPRMGGEKRYLRDTGHRPGGSPPHGRGKAGSASVSSGCRRITPAWAGKRLKRSHRSGIFISGPIPFHSVLHRPAGSGGSRAGRDGSPAGQPQNAGPA